MTSVKSDARSVPDHEVHAPMLMGLLFEEVRAGIHTEDWGGLRQSHMRMVSGVPQEGISVTDLAQRVRMTKQGCGQFVAQLTASGHLSVEAQPGDRRVRLVRRTEQGEAFVAAVTRRLLAIEATWAERVGSEAYAGFRGVLEELTLGRRLG